jgi:hypothetical protein
MPNRVQTLRSSVPGNLPQAATRAPGELWLNFADAHIGYIDASQTAQKLLAVRLFVSTASYATGDFVVYTGALYQAIAPSAAGAFTAANWSRIGTMQDLSQYLNLAGGTLTGALNLPAAAPTVATQATNKSYVDAGDAAATTVANTKLALAGGTLTGALNGTTANFSGALAAASATFSGVAAAADPPDIDNSNNLVTTEWYRRNLPATKENSNRLINGDMRIDQRNSGASGTAVGYTIDRWSYNATQTGKGTWTRSSVGAAAFANGLGWALNFTSSSAYASVAADIFAFYQTIEADMVTDFAFGTPNAQPITLSFWAQSSLAGTFGGCIQNQPGPITRAYPFTYSIPVANTWTKIIVTIPGDTAGTWVNNGAAGWGRVVFDLGTGANARAPAGAWASGSYWSATGAASIVAVNGASISFSNVKLEIGSVATPFNRQSLAKLLADCQRYFLSMSPIALVGYGAAGSGCGAYFPFPTTMRATPTIAFGTFTLANCAAPTAGGLSTTGFLPQTTVTALGAYSAASGSFTASAEL